MRLPLASLLGVVALGATALAAPPASAPAVPAAPAPSPRTLGALRAAAARADDRLLSLVADASMDPNLRRVRIYAGFSEVQLADPKHPVQLEELLEIAMDKDVVADIREEAVNAIVDDRTQRSDPDLSMEGRKAARPRVKFSLKVVRFLNDPDQVSRALASKILQTMWPGARDKDVKEFDPRKRETWGNARAAWTRFLGP